MSENKLPEKKPETNNLPAIPEEIKVSPILKNFFFSTFKMRKEYKKIQQEQGEIRTVSVIINHGKAILRSLTTAGKNDVPFEDQEFKTLVKRIGIKQKQIDESKFIIVMMDMKKHNIHILQTKLNGEKKEFTI